MMMRIGDGIYRDIIQEIRDFAWELVIVPIYPASYPSEKSLP
jgi:hypothetical protein